MDTHRPRRKRRRPQRFCDEGPTTLGARTNDSEGLSEGDDDDNYYGTEYVDGIDALDSEDEYVNDDDDDDDEPSPPEPVSEFQRTTHTSRPLRIVDGNNNEKRWWNRLEGHMAFACVTGFITLVSLVLAILLMTQENFMDHSRQLCVKANLCEAGLEERNPSLTSIFGIFLDQE